MVASVGYDLDVLVVGAGFCGIYQLYLLRQQGFKVKLIDRASDVGGVWQWNRYPGAMSDSESYIYRYSWDKELLDSWELKNNYAKQSEILAYLQLVVERHNLREDMIFNTDLVGAQWNETSKKWEVETAQGVQFTTRYLVTGLGHFSKVNYPNINSLGSFQGDIYHTSRWPADCDLTGKRVAVLGNGSTGMQVICALGNDPKIAQLTSFQRTPQYTVPARDGPMDPKRKEEIKSSYDQIWDNVFHSKVGLNVDESTTPFGSVSPEERRRKFQECWDMGGGVRFLHAFSDILQDMEANLYVCDFIKEKIADIVKDPEKRRKLMPKELYARRPICDNGYYATFNNEKVDLVSLEETPITEVTSRGIKTSDNVEREFDVIVLATGFDAIDGPYKELELYGRNKTSLKQQWGERSSTYLSISVPNFPNLFILGGPLGPLSNQPPSIEVACEFVTRTISYAEKKNVVLEATTEATEGWVDICDKLAENSLMKTTKSWMVGGNIPGKKKAILFFGAGLQAFKDRLTEVSSAEWAGFQQTPRSS